MYIKRAYYALFIIVSVLVQAPGAVPEPEVVQAPGAVPEQAVPESVPEAVPESVPESAVEQAVIVCSAQLRSHATYNSSWAVPLFL